MSDTRTFSGARALICAPDGPPLSDKTATHFISDAWEADARLVAVPVERLAPGFLDLATGIAGEVFQKFVNYGIGLAIIGDIEDRKAASRALRDFVYEANNGKTTWFVDDVAALEKKLSV